MKLNFGKSLRREGFQLSKPKHISLDKFRTNHSNEVENRTSLLRVKRRLQDPQQDGLPQLLIQVKFPNDQVAKLRIKPETTEKLKPLILKLLRAKRSWLPKSEGGGRLVVTAEDLRLDILLNNMPSTKIRDILKLRVFQHQISATNAIRNYQILRVIGEGGFSKVVLAKNRDNGQYYAMKVLSKTFLRSKEATCLVENELLMMKTLKHPNIVKLFQSFETEEFICFVLEFCSPGSVHRLLRLSRFTEDQARFVVWEVLRALCYLHENEVVYRDLKPENVLLASDGHIKLCDFGLAKYCPGKVQSFTFCGSPDYVAPEVLTKEGYSQEVDFYSLGILAYQLIVGEPPRAEQGQAFEMPKFVSQSAADFITLLTQLDEKMRPCAGQLQQHPWLKGAGSLAVFRREAKMIHQGSDRNSFFLSLVREQLSQLKDSKFRVQPTQKGRGLAFERGEAGEDQKGECVIKLKKTGLKKAQFLRC